MRGYLTHTYLIALGSNQRHPVLGAPRAVIGAACAALADEGLELCAVSGVVSSRPLGPSQRLYANAAALAESALDPPEMLALLQRIERAFGRRARGQRWRARVLDLDIVLWSGGIWTSAALAIPHPRFRTRRFVLGPASAIAPHWCDPLTHLPLRALDRRLTRPRPAPRGAP